MHEIEVLIGYKICKWFVSTQKEASSAWKYLLWIIKKYEVYVRSLFYITRNIVEILENIREDDKERLLSSLELKD